MRKHEAQAIQATAPAPAMKPAPPTPIDTKKAEVGGPTWDPAWDKIVELALPPEMLSREVPQDVRRFCPRFYRWRRRINGRSGRISFRLLRERRRDWSRQCRPASQPEMVVKDEVTGRQGRTSGLLQLTYEDQKRYGCDFDWEHDKTLKVEDPGEDDFAAEEQSGVRREDFGSPVDGAA